MHKCGIQVKEKLKRCKFSWVSSYTNTIYCSKVVKCKKCSEDLNFRNRCSLPCIHFRQQRWYHIQFLNVLNSKTDSLE
jgi:hypothetical protein